MQIPATIFEVNREQSVVKLHRVASRPQQFTRDARHIITQQHAYGPRVAQQVVPGLCRSAVEAHLQVLAWRGLLKEGRSHQEIHEKISDVSMQDLAALAFYCDSSRGGDVYKYLDNKGRKNADTFRAIKEGVHQFKGDADGLVKDTTFLLQSIGAIL